MRRARPLLLLALLCLLVLAAVPDRALELRNLALAQLENERPADAEATLLQLVQIAPADPLGYADLAVACLRQQKYEAALAWAEKALARTPRRADLLALKGEVLQWSGRSDEALAAFGAAADAAPDDPEIQYAAYRQAAALIGGAGAAGSAAAALATKTLERLARLRPENLVVLLRLGSSALAAGGAGDRAAATAAYLRVREIAGGEATAEGPLREVLDALERDDLAAARVPAIRLENVLKVTPMYQGSQRELARNIQGVPLTRFAGEPPPSRFGAPVKVELKASLLDPTPSAGAGLAVADLDGDRRPDIVRLVGGDRPGIEVRLAASGWKALPVVAAPGASQLLAVDLDNDSRTDVIAWGERGGQVFLGNGQGGLRPAPESFRIAGGGAAGNASAAAVLDYDGDGDLDLAVAGSSGAGLELYRNNLAGLQAVGASALPRPSAGVGLAGSIRQILASDLDRDGDLDLLLVQDVAGRPGLAWLDNLRQGRFADRTAAAGLDQVPAARAALAVDLDDDGLPDLVTLAAAGDSLAFWHNRGGRFERWSLSAPLPAGSRYSTLLAFDADNDGRLDLALAGDSGVLVLARRSDSAGGDFQPLPLSDGPARATALAAADLDGDGDLDLVAAGPLGLYRIENVGGNKNRWLDVRLKGLARGSGKNNLAGLGATLEVRAGTAYQFREVTGQVTHFGLGGQRQADLRVVWTNGVPQNRLQVAGDRTIVEEQLLKGSCPFLYAWNGRRTEFVTDLLWASPLGLPVAPGVWAGANPGELVEVVGTVPAGGSYRLSLTEELWEAAYFDRVRLWVVDAPPGVEVASNLKVLPGAAPFAPLLLASRGLRPVAAAWDGGGREVTERVRRRDEVYADGYEKSSYQGVAAAPWTFTFDLGAAPAAPIRLHLDGWVFPADASLNLAAAQRPDLPVLPPRLEVETATGWQVLVPAMGYPAGKTKTMVVDTPPLPPGARRLRIVTSLWLSWDRIAWTARPDDGAAAIVARLDPATADLHYRGFSAPVRRSPNGPHGADYGRLSTVSPWLPFAGRYTRYGDVRELLAAADDRLVILAAGDEVALAFDASRLAPPPAGWSRRVFLESLGWDKDADRNTWEAERLEPLPFRAMRSYPFAPGERYPETPFLRRYREEWLTREVR
ncbi:MAG TPA: FG-GAP-like repeat-containing protein [Thermoanaerobaculia bacterium]|nr:FG-GAP-like repeat-containing protein [Thermoanaerobaculia bacterium]